ncbi:hypothetical protein AUP68_07771 [Ilyonectria robusta]
MFPSHQSSSEKTPAGSASSAQAAARKKPFESSDETSAIFEEDMFRGLGRVLEDDIIDHPLQVDLGPESMHPFQPMMPWRESTAGQSDTSDTGKSLSMPTDRLSSANLSQRHEAATPEAQMVHPASHNRAIRSFFRNYEFSWKDSRLLFASESFDFDRAPETPSCIADPGSGTASTKTPIANPRSESNLSRAPELQRLLGAGLFGMDGLAASWAAGGVEPHSAAMTDLDTETLRPTQAVFAYGKTLDEMVEYFLDHFLRSYAPQRSQKRNRATRNDQDASLGGRDSARRATRNGKSTGRTNGPPRGKLIGGSGEDEDEDSHGKGQRSSATAHFASLPYLACPFLKFKPNAYTACAVKLTTISHVKDHLKGKHYKRYCTKCYQTFGKRDTTNHGCIPKPTAPVELITTQKLEALDRRVDRTKCLTEKWQYFYKVLFPDAPLCRDPFLDLIRTEQTKALEDYLRSRGAMMLLRAVVKHSKFRGEIAAECYRLYHEEFFPRLLELESAFNSDMDSLNDISGELAEHDNQTPDLAHRGQTPVADPDEIFTFVSRFTESHGLQRSPDPTEPIQTYPFMDLNGHSTSFDGQPSIDIGDRQRPNTAEMRDLEHTAPASNMWNPPFNFSECQTDAEFSCPLFAEDATFETRNEEGFMSWNAQ